MLPAGAMLLVPRPSHGAVAVRGSTILTGRIHSSIDTRVLAQDACAGRLTFSGGAVESVAVWPCFGGSEYGVHTGHVNNSNGRVIS
jgi:hypothetical protein